MEMTFYRWVAAIILFPSPPYQFRRTRILPSLTISTYAPNKHPIARVHASDEGSERWRRPFADGVDHIDVFHRRHTKSIRRKLIHRSQCQNLHVITTPLRTHANNQR